MTEKNVTIRDIARASNVSIATVSRVINNSGSVSPECKAKVQSVIERYAYRPNSIARNLKMDVTKTIAMVVGDGLNEYFAEITNGLDNTLREDGYIMFLCNSQNNQAIEANNLRLIEEKQVDGLIINTSGYNNEEIVRISNKIPTVLLHRRLNAPGFKGDFLDADHGWACYELTMLMIKNGHKKIAYVNGPMHLSSMADRFVNFRRAMATIGVQVTTDYEYYYEGPLTQDYGRYAVEDILSKPNPATAIIIAHGETTLGAMRYFKRKNIHVPNQISFATTANVTMADLLYIHPTYCMPDCYVLGVRAAELIMSRIRSQNELPNREVNYMPMLCEGNSIKNLNGRIHRAYGEFLD